MNEASLISKNLYEYGPFKKNRTAIDGLSIEKKSIISP